MPDDRTRDELKCSVCGATRFACVGCGAHMPGRAALSAPAPDGDDDCVTIDQLDRAEEWLSKLARLAGCEREWSNLHYHGQCIADALAPAPPDPELDALVGRLQRLEVEIAWDESGVPEGCSSEASDTIRAAWKAIEALRRTRTADTTCGVEIDFSPNWGGYCALPSGHEGRHSMMPPSFASRPADAGEDGKS